MCVCACVHMHVFLPNESLTSRPQLPLFTFLPTPRQLDFTLLGLLTGQPRPWGHRERERERNRSYDHRSDLRRRNGYVRRQNPPSAPRTKPHSTDRKLKHGGWCFLNVSAANAGSSPEPGKTCHSELGGDSLTGPAVAWSANPPGEHSGRGWHEALRPGVTVARGGGAQ